MGDSASVSANLTFGLEDTLALPVTRTVRCRRCGQAANLSYTPEDVYSFQGWICPSVSCRAVQPITLKGTLVNCSEQFA